MPLLPSSIALFLRLSNRFFFIGYYRFPHCPVYFSGKLLARLDGDVLWDFEVHLTPACKMQSQGYRATPMMTIKDLFERLKILAVDVV